jgi:hypothetical protein
VKKYASKQCASLKPSLKNTIGQKESIKEESILLKRASGNQRSTGMVDREIKSLRGHESSSELFCSAVIYHEKHIDLAVYEKGTKWGKTHEMPQVVYGEPS